MAAACGGGAPSELEWRDLSLELPAGWTAFEEEPTRLSISNVPLGADVTEEERPTGDVLAMFFTHEPATLPADWRRFLDDAGATIEVDEAIEVGQLPATRLQFLTSGDDGSAPTRELVVLVPSREVVILAQPVPLPGDEDAPEVFDRGVEAFDAVLDSITWGVPAD